MSANPNLVPPAVKTKTDAPKTAKSPKAVKKPADPNAPKKERAPRKDLGISNESVITVQEKLKEAKFRGKRADYRELMLKFNGKKVADFVEAAKAKDTGKGGSGRSWVRWFVEEGYVNVTRVEKPAPAPKS